MQPVVGLDDFKRAVAGRARQAQMVHRGVVHAHHQADAAGLFRGQPFVVGWGTGTECAGAKVEASTLLPGISQVGEEAQKEAGEEEETNPFVGEWLCEKASIYIDEQDGTFDVFIMWDVSDTEEDIWEYSCKLDAETGVLTGEGKKSHEVIDGEGEVVSSEEVYTDGSATFALEDGALIWDDAKEAVAQGMRFERGEEDELLEEYDEIDETEDAEDEETEDEASAN